MARNELVSRGMLTKLIAQISMSWFDTQVSLWSCGSYNRDHVANLVGEE